MWKLVQVGILFVLAIVAGMLFGVQKNKDSAPQSPAESAVAPTPAEVPSPAPEPSQPAPPRSPEPIRSPEPPVTAAARPAPTAAPATPTPRASAPRSPTPAPQRPVATPQPPAVAAPTPESAPDTIAAPVEPAAPNPPPAAVIPPPSGSTTAAARRGSDRQPRTVTLPAGLSLVVRLNRALSTARHQTGDSFTATLDEPIIIDKMIIADRGATVEGRIVEADRAGRVSGRSQLSVTLTNLHTDDGQIVQLATSRFDVQGEGQVGKTAKRAAIGAGIGAAIGAIAGGGKGAAIGAGTGAGAGAGSEAVRRGEDAMLRAESRLFFRLEQPLEIRERL
jgi:hypothetical protein